MKSEAFPGGKYAKRLPDPQSFHGVAELSTTLEVSVVQTMNMQIPPCFYGWFEGKVKGVYKGGDWSTFGIVEPRVSKEEPN